MTAPWPHIAEDEVAAVAAVLRSGKVNYWTGQQGKAFEQAFAAYHNTKYGIALANGTVALELALVALNIGPGDEVIVTSRTFVASASAIIMRGAKPVFADIDLNSQNITVNTIKAVHTPETKAIIAVHLAGWPCDMPAIMAYAQQQGLMVIEDCAQAHGASINGQKVGSFGHMSAFSFCQDKIMTTGGEGGMLLTNDQSLWEKAWSFKDHGKNYHTVFNQSHPPGFRWLHEEFGTNWRMTEMQAAIGLKQLEKLPQWLEKRQKFANLYQQAFKKIPFIRTTTPEPHIQHVYYKYYVFIKPEKLPEGHTRDTIMQAFNDAGVTCLSGSCSEIYLEKCFEKHNLQPAERLPIAKQLGETSLMFLVHPTLTEDNINNNIAKIEAVAHQICKKRTTVPA